MFKLLLKSIQIGVLSGALLNLNTVVWAQSTTQNTVAASSTQTSANQKQVDAKLTTNGIDESAIAATLAMVSISLLTQRLWSCKMTTDMMIAAGAGAAFFAGELLAAIKLKQAMKDIQTDLTRNDKGMLEQKQIEVLQKLKQSYEEAKGTANTKKMLQTVAAAAFIAAAAMAYVNASSELASQAAVDSTLATAALTCTSMFASTCAAAGGCYPPFKTGAATATTNATKYNAFEVKALGPADSYAKFAEEQTQKTLMLGQYSLMNSQCPAASQASVALATSNTVKLATRAWCPVPLSVSLSTISKSLYANSYTPIIPEKESFNLFKTLFLSEAKADMLSPLGIIKSAGTVYLIGKFFGNAIDQFLYAPVNRAMVWGGLAALSYAATTATNKQIEIIDANIKKIEDILNGFKKLENGIETANTPTTSPKVDPTKVDIYKPGITNVNNAGYKDIDLKGNGGGSLPCITGDAGNCTSYSAALNKREEFKNMPVEFQSQMKDFGSFTDGLNGTSSVSASTLSAGGSLVSAQKSFSAALAKQQSAVQSKLKLNGSKLDLAKGTKDFEKSLMASLKNELEAKHTNASAVLSGIGPNEAGSVQTAIAKEKDKDKDSNAKKSNYDAGTIVDISAPTTGFGSQADKSLELDKLSKNEEPKLDTSGKTSSNIDDYEMRNDITQNKESSIFELISNRYIKSGYPRLFKKLQE